MAQFGRALRSGRRGRKFESCHLDQFKTTQFRENPRLRGFFVFVGKLGGAPKCNKNASKQTKQAVTETVTDTDTVTDIIINNNISSVSEKQKTPPKKRNTQEQEQRAGLLLARSFSYVILLQYPTEPHLQALKFYVYNRPQSQ